MKLTAWILAILTVAGAAAGVHYTFLKAEECYAAGGQRKPNTIGWVCTIALP